MCAELGRAAHVPLLQAQLRAPNASVVLCRALPSAVSQQQQQQALGSSSGHHPALSSLWGLGNLILLMAGPCATSFLPNGRQVCGTGCEPVKVTCRTIGGA